MEAEILKDLAAGRFHAAFEAMVELYQIKVLRLAYSMLHDETLAQDVAQDAFVKIWKSLPGFRQESSLSTWMYSIVRNTCLTELKKRRDHPLDSIEEPVIGKMAEEMCHDADSSSAGREMDITALLEKLPEKYRQVIALFYLEQRSYEELASLLGLPMGTVKSLLFRARKELLAASRGRNRILTANV